MSHCLRATSLATLVTCAAWTSACSVIIAPENIDVLCQLDPALADPCPIGFECVDGLCLEAIRPPPPPDGCVPRAEECNGEDDNCNGLIDDGVDADGDGYTFCGTQRGPDGTFIAGSLMPVFVDCADDDPSTHPMAPERCDGIDNDCVSSTPPDPLGVCADGFTCSVRSRTCVNSLDCRETGCSETQACNPDTHACVDVTCPTCSGATPLCDVATATCIALRADGEGCNLDNECMSGACFNLTQLGATSTTVKQGVCSRACCNDGQCVGVANSCFEAPSGARACLPTGAPSALGLALRANVGCSSLSSMCSFSYQPTGWCEDDTGSICYFAGAAACLWGISPDLCGSPCETGQVCGGSDTRCGFVLSNDTVAGVCYQFTAHTYADTGGPCSTGADCRDGVCIAGTCAKPCCNDADCDTDVGKCLPSPGTFALMRCQVATAPPL